MTAWFLQQPVDSFLDLVAAREPAPGGGAVAAVTVASAAALAAMSARFSDGQLPDSGELAAHADRLRQRALRLAGQDATVYAAVLDAYALPREPDPHPRSAAIKRALRTAAEVPLAVATAAADVAGVALRVAEEGNPNLAGDAVTAILLSDAAARSAATLVQINARLGALGPGLPERAGESLRCAAQAAERAAAWR